MKIIIIATFAALGALGAHIAHAAPSISVAPIGFSIEGNRVWNFQIVPDPDLGPLAVELAFAIDHTDLVGVDVNTSVWDTENPGNNPFTGTETTGLWVDLIGDRTFGAFGSIVLTEPGPVELFHIETAGSGLTTLRWGVAASGHPSRGARIAQEVDGVAQNFDGHTGSITVPEPAGVMLFLLGVASFAAPTARKRG
jgi:hypothetical protein